MVRVVAGGVVSGEIGRHAVLAAVVGRILGADVHAGVPGHVGVVELVPEGRRGGVGRVLGDVVPVVEVAGLVEDGVAAGDDELEAGPLVGLEDGPLGLEPLGAGFVAVADVDVVVADGVPFDVCTSVKDRKPNWAEAIAVNGLEDVCHETENNFVSFFFNDELTDLVHDYCENNSDCGECGTCKNNKCSYGFKDKNGSCFSCDVIDRSYKGRLSTNNVTREECSKCKNRMWSNPDFAGIGRCVARMEHIDNYWGSVPKDECEKFPNQYSMGNPGICFYCDGTYDPTTGICSTTTCERNVWADNIHGVDEATCIQCGGNFRIRHMGGKILTECDNLPTE